MWKMPFYDVMLLYNTHENNLKGEQEQVEQTKSSYNEEMENMMSNTNNIKMPKLPDLNNITKGIIK